jgi:hypothetical protein
MSRHDITIPLNPDDSLGRVKVKMDSIIESEHVLDVELDIADFQLKVVLDV